MGCRAFFAIPAAGGSFFFCSWLMMIFAGFVPGYFGITDTLNYIESMIATIALWLVIAPLVGAIAGRRGGWRPWGRWR